MGDSLIRIGTEVDGDPALACPHMAQWWPVFTRLVKDRFGVSLEILQAAGSYSKSGATHVEGTSIDWRTWRFAPAVVNGIVALAREMGARATWYRTKAQGFDPHVHMALDCPCRSGADYQTAAVDAGYNGLGKNGRGGEDTHPQPSTRRDYKAGIAWANQQLNGGLTMAQIDELKAAIAALTKKVDYNTEQLKAIDGKANGRARMNADAAATANIVKAGLAPIAKQLDTKPSKTELNAAVSNGISKVLDSMSKD